MKGILVVVALFLFLSIPIAMADSGNIKEVQYYGIEARINKDFSVAHTVTLIFEGVVSNIEYNFPAELYNLNVENKYGKAECRTENVITGTKILCKIITNSTLTNKTHLDISFNTTDSVKKLFGNYKFEASYDVSMPIKSLFTIVYLPSTGVLAGDNASNSYSPEGGNVMTDGKHIMVYWQRSNVSTSDNLKYDVMYILPGGPDDMNNIIITIFAIIALVVIIGIGFVMRRGSKDTVIENVMPILNKEEKKIVDILREHNGQAMQKIIVIETDFSKAKVSRLIKDLAGRGIIEVESLGKKNRINLKAKLEKKEESAEEKTNS